MKFLIVDDSPTIRMTLKAALKQCAGANVKIGEASDAGSAISEFRLAPPDVVFLDMMLATGAGGKEVLKVLLRERPSAKVVLCTGLPPEHADVVGSISMGAFAYLQKPVRTEAVRKVIAQIDEESGRSGRIR